MADQILFGIKYLLLVLCDVMDVALFVRMIFSWIDPEMENRVSVFLFTLTEPLILPLRALFDRFRWFENSFFDMPFIFTALIIALIEFAVRLTL